MRSMVVSKTSLFPKVEKFVNGVFAPRPFAAAGLYALRAPSRPSGRLGHAVTIPGARKTQLEILGRNLGIETTGESTQSLEQPDTLRYEQV